MNQFQRLTASAFRQSIRVTGAVLFVLRGTQRNCTITDLTEEEKYAIGQVIKSAVATLEFAFERFAPALKNGELLTVTRNGRTDQYRIGRIAADEVSIQLTLEDPNE